MPCRSRQVYTPPFTLSMPCSSQNATQVSSWSFIQFRSASSLFLTSGSIKPPTFGFMLAYQLELSLYLKASSRCGWHSIRKLREYKISCISEISGRAFASCVGPRSNTYITYPAKFICYTLIIVISLSSPMILYKSIRKRLLDIPMSQRARIVRIPIEQGGKD